MKRLLFTLDLDFLITPQHTDRVNIFTTYNIFHVSPLLGLSKFIMNV